MSTLSSRHGSDHASRSASGSASAVDPALGVRSSHSAPIIVATDGRRQSDGALVLGRLLADAPDALRLVTVMKPVPSVRGEPSPATADVDAARRADVRREITHQVDRVWQGDGGVELLEGDPATAVTRLAHSTRASLIVAGLGRHRVSDRVFGDETALRFIRMADVPVLAVAEGLDHAPMRIVVAVDFAETSQRAARLAMDLAAPGATVYLAHVAPRGGSGAFEWDGWGVTYKQDAGDALQRAESELRAPSDITLQRILLQGDPATELLAFAASVNADLIATGSHGKGFVARMLVGSVTTRIVRCSTCSVLTVPHAAVMTRMRTTVEPPSVSMPPRDQWPTALADFTRRNAGRRGTLEVDDPDLDAQGQVFDFPLAGVDWDARDQRIEVMLGDLTVDGRHLTHSIGGVTSIAIMRDEQGRDLALRIAHGAGLTLLTFTS